MTVCIAATVLGKYVVTICDRKACMAGFSADNMIEKEDPVHPSWIAMVSGDDITPSVPIWNRVREKLGFEFGSETVPQPKDKTLDEVARAFVSSYQEYRKQEITDRFLAGHDLTVESFLNEGKKLLGLSLFTDVWNQMTQFEIKCTFLVAGFDKYRNGHIFTIEDPGTYVNYDSLGFWAIGSGQQQALSSIFFTESSSNPTLEAILCDLCAAKFMAETAEGVGRGTNFLVHSLGEPPRFYDDNALDALRQLWESEGKPRRPKGTEELIKQLPLHKMTQSK